MTSVVNYFKKCRSPLTKFLGFQSVILVVYKPQFHCFSFLYNCVWETQTLHTFVLNYFPLLDCLQIRFSIKPFKSKTKKAGSPSKTERDKSPNSCTEPGAEYLSTPKLTESRNLPVTKVRHLLQPETCCTKITLTINKYKRIEALARFKNKKWWIDLTYVDKRENKNGVRYLLVRRDLFGWTTEAKGKKAKESK